MTFDLDTLRSRYGEPSDLSRRKTLCALDRHCRSFIENSPFLVLATADAHGRTDASPRGDAPGFVHVIDERTLLLPDRPGNRRLDSIGNVATNPNVGLIFFVPGVNETLRVNGRATLVEDAGVLAPLAHRGRAPLSALRIEVEEAFLHCAKALVRSRLWDPDRHIERKTFPTLGRMLADQIPDLDADDADGRIDQSMRENLY